MKIFSMLFTVLFFLGFANMTYAESVYTVTNKLEADDDDLFMFILDHTKVEIVTAQQSKRMAEIMENVYIMKPDECVRVKTSQFDNLFIISDDRRLIYGGGRTLLCRPEAATKKGACQPNNYEIFNDGGFLDSHIIQAIDQPNISRHCIDIERWIKVKEQEYFDNN